MHFSIFFSLQLACLNAMHKYTSHLPVPNFFQQGDVFVIPELSPNRPKQIHYVSMSGNQNNTQGTLQLSTKC